jgi:hypothetical protein
MSHPLQTGRLRGAQAPLQIISPSPTRRTWNTPMLRLERGNGGEVHSCKLQITHTLPTPKPDKNPLTLHSWGILYYLCHPLMVSLSNHRLLSVNGKSLSSSEAKEGWEKKSGGGKGWEMLYITLYRMLRIPANKAELT